MKYFILGILLSVSSFAQTFNVNPDTTLIKIKECKPQHQQILDFYAKSLDSQISRLMDGLNQESARQTSDDKMRLYYEFFGELIIQRMIVEKMQQELNAYDFKKLNDPYKHDKNIFNSDLKIDFDQKFNKTVEKALKEHKNAYVKKNIEGFTDGIRDGFISKIRNDTLKYVGKKILAKFLNISFKKIGEHTLRTLAIRYGAKVIMGAAKGTVIDLLTLPLMGKRLSPEDEWTDLLKEYPEMIINPEWMTNAGSDDHPWYTHCYAILRRTQKMETALKKFLSNEESSFIRHIISIDDPDIIEDLSSDKGITRRIVSTRDATKVTPPRYIKRAPNWAYKK